ncbi:MAG: hypothetical protein KDC13_04585 [Bacteroidetes bacterium]|nr:hypothetical protein [Bacteroidota bacterium]
MEQTILNTLEDQLKAMVSSGQIRYNQMLKVMEALPGDTALNALTQEHVALINLKLNEPEDECEFCSG